MSLTYKPASLFKRLAAIGYDLFLLVALLFIATAVILPLNQGEAISSDSNFFTVYLIYLFIVSFLFFGWFWTHGGQTLGMKTWHIQLVSTNNQAVTWQQALIRYLVAIISWALIGLGFVWSLLNVKKVTWHDILSNTILIDIE